jgi:hypothetical protein
LGCVLLEISVLQEQGTLDYIRRHRAADPAFHANLNNIGKWLDGPISKPRSVRRARLVDEIRSMLSPRPPQRPTAKQVLVRLSGYDIAHRVRSNHSIFGDCCKPIFMPFKLHREQVTRQKHHENELEKAQSALERAERRVEDYERKSTEDRDSCTTLRRDKYNTAVSRSIKKPGVHCSILLGI